jgi:demethylmenaquinone methyltransferase/2-methoxy-6-polyprenyl-1,4-benzoquinol methylase
MRLAITWCFFAGTLSSIRVERGDLPTARSLWLLSGDEFLIGLSFRGFSGKDVGVASNPIDGSIQAASVRDYFARIARRYDFANTVLSLGVDVLWRLRAAGIVQAWNPARILDLATGSGELAKVIDRACPDALLVGVDFCEPMLRVAREKDIPNLVVADALHLPFGPSCFDAVTVAFGLRNMGSWTGALREMLRVLSPGGHLLILDFGLPKAPLLFFYRFYLHKVLPLFASLLTGERSAYDYLADSIESFPSGDQMCDLLEQNGCLDARCIRLLGGIAAIYTAKRA